MNYEKHTPAPWKYNLRDNPDPELKSVAPLTIYHDELDEPGSCGGTEDVLGEFQDEADAARAVDCVNACAGLNPAAVPAMVEAAQDVAEWHDLIAQNYPDMAGLLRGIDKTLAALAQLEAEE